MPTPAMPPPTLDQPGEPAIRPNAVSTDPAVPSFTADDVRAYVATHPHLNQIPDAPAATVASVAFLPVQAVDERLGAGTGMRPDTLLRVVALHGGFIVTGPPGHRACGARGTGPRRPGT